MSDSQQSDVQQSVATVEPEILVSSCTASGEVLFRNEAWKRTLGDLSDLWTNLVDDDKEIAGQNLKEAAGGSLITNAVFMLKQVARDLPLPVLLHFIPILTPGADSGNGSRMIVITGEILAEPESWTENQTEKHRMETLGRMTMGIVHDFNNLLSGILGHISLAKSSTEIPESLNEHILTIEKAANDGAALVDKIQRYIRQEKQASFEILDLTSLIQDCVILTKPYWYNEPRRQGISIELSFESGELPPILGSASELRDVFVNLILNAVQALPESGKINISTSHTEDDVVVLVEDSGTGMSQAVRERIFEPLFTTKGGRGSGMGLAVVFGVMQEHEGSIEVKSKLSFGTTFTLSFPIHTGTTRHDVAPEKHVSNDPVSVLVVDDEDMVRNVIEKLLKLRGHSVSSVSSALEALIELETHSFDVVISDQGMPEMSGRELARKIRVLYPDLPVILLTGDTDLNVDSNDIASVVPKPFQASDLEEAIRAVA
ncbi:MAG: response regulator [Bacteroidetes bacterium]|nr:MAG: response regulator [Bacteroidota bacterium]